MKSIVSFLFILFSQVALMQAQEVSAVVLDSKTRQPIPFATIQYAPGKGVITNEEGNFSLYGKLSEKDSLIISSMGYETLTISSGELTAESILLKPSAIELQNVFLTNKNLTGKEIIAKVKENVTNNYNFDLTQKRFFFRSSHINNIRKFDLKVDKSTFPDLDQKLMSSISEKIPKYSDSYKEVLGDFYGNYETQKLQVIKAANLHNPQSTVGLTELTDKLERIFKENIKSNSFLKIKSGIIGVKVDAEELEKEINEEKKVAEKSVVKTAEQLEKEEEDRKKRLTNSTNSKVQSLMQTVFWKEAIALDVFEKPGKYKFEVEGYTQIDDFIVYIISFQPKRGADFKGKIYVNTVDYGVARLDYSNVKPLKSFRLFGISTKEDVYRGKMIFNRTAAGKYDPKYLELERGDSFGIKRPLTIIEKNKFVKGKRKQNELDLDININSGDISKYELVIYENSPLGKEQFEALNTATPFEYETFKIYNPDFWTGYNIIEPNAAIKAFTALEQDKPYF